MNEARTRSASRSKLVTVPRLLEGAPPPRRQPVMGIGAS
jgi:hypothetical protein